MKSSKFYKNIYKNITPTGLGVKYGCTFLGNTKLYPPDRKSNIVGGNSHINI